jgi:hypothetical protein
MTSQFSDLLHRSAESAGEPRLDVESLVREAGRRQGRRRAVAVAAAAVVVGLVTAGSLALGNDHDRPGPAPVAPSPTPTSPEPPATSTRPLVYAEGKTVHVGDDTFQARARVPFVAATDDGVVFMTEDGDPSRLTATLWFNDGSSSEIIGRVLNQHVGYRYVFLGNPGSLVVWADATSGTRGAPDRFTVYDTSRRAVVARLPFTTKYNEFFGELPAMLYVDDGSFFFSPVPETPGCWVDDAHRCSHPRLFRYDVALGATEKIGLATFEAELSTNSRMFVLGSGTGDTGTSFTALDQARFDQVGRRLVPVDDLTRSSGESIRLRPPGGFTNNVYELSVMQWLDEDRVVLWSADPTQDDGDIPAGPGALLVCSLSGGDCRVATQSSSIIVPPGG